MRLRALHLLAVPSVVAAVLAVRAATSSTPGAADHATGAVDHESPTERGDPASERASSRPGNPSTAPDSDGASDSTGAATTTLAATDGGALSAGDRARVTESSPTGVRVALDTPIVLHFDRPPVKEAVTLSTDPPAEGRSSWVDAQTLSFTPARWAEGKPYHVRVEGDGVETATFDFRSLVPPPERIEPGRGERITLTFDDGADRPAQVTALLDFLEKERIEAIFFPTGRWADANPRLVERMSKDGHRVCNHTYSHQNLRIPQLTEEEIRTEIARGAGDGRCRLFRPPLKAFDPRVERIVASMGLTLYLWDVDSRDWEGAPAEDIVNLVLGRAHPGAVVLFHMHAQASLDALPRIVPRLRKAGYVFRETADAGAPQ